MSNKTFTTNNYDRFYFNPTNRPIKESHVKSLMNSISKFGLLVPILCDKEDHIVDGQHRFEACKRLRHPVTVQVRESYDMRKIVEVNTMSRKWSMIDYAHHYAAKGNEHYKYLLEMRELYPDLMITGVVMACALKNLDTKGFKAGALECPDKEKTIDVLHLMAHAKLHGLGHQRHHPANVRYVLAGHCVEMMIERLEMVSDNMKVEKPRNAKDALRVWEDIYNWKRRTNTIKL